MYVYVYIYIYIILLIPIQDTYVESYNIKKNRIETLEGESAVTELLRALETLETRALDALETRISSVLSLIIRALDARALEARVLDARLDALDALTASFSSK